MCNKIVWDRTNSKVVTSGALYKWVVDWQAGCRQMNYIKNINISNVFIYISVARGRIVRGILSYSDT